MRHIDLIELLNAVASGERDVADVARALAQGTVAEVSSPDGPVHARLDLHRELRCGFPEVVFSQGKTDEQVDRKSVV